MEQYATVRKLALSRYERVIVTSDLHGDLRGYQALKARTAFSERDALIIVGDILEKGNRSLALLREVMQDAAHGNVFMTMGNNDYMTEGWKAGRFTEDDILMYLHSLGSAGSIITDIASEQGIVIRSTADARRVREAFLTHYDRELAFLEGLPDILETEDYIFVHAGIRPGDLACQDREYCLTAKEFAHQKYRFEKPVIVGHWPVTNYSGSRIVNRVYYDPAMPLYSIDGGNSLQDWGQINYLVIHPDTKTVTDGFLDDLPVVRLLDDQKESADPLTVLFPDTEVHVLARTGNGYICELPRAGRRVTVRDVFTYRGKTYCADLTDYEPCVHAGETASLCRKEAGRILIKKDGVIGCYTGRYELLP